MMQRLQIYADAGDQAMMQLSNRLNHTTKGTA